MAGSAIKDDSSPSRTVSSHVLAVTSPRSGESIVWISLFSLRDSHPPSLSRETETESGASSAIVRPGWGPRSGAQLHAIGYDQHNTHTQGHIRSLCVSRAYNNDHEYLMGWSQWSVGSMPMNNGTAETAINFYYN